MNEERKKAMKILKTARGQVDSVITMIEDDRYCIDIANQILAVNGLLKRANLEILKQHINHCVKEAFEEDAGEEKVDEVIKVIGRLIDTK
ncbi:metal-sensing transcriptional repressor [Vallitaleaceae bacterium 9-2]